MDTNNQIISNLSPKNIDKPQKTINKVKKTKLIKSNDIDNVILTIETETN